MMEPMVKGWCPGAYRPMMSGDGLVVRVRPRLARLTREQALGLCAAAQTYGNGIMDLTSRSNLQIRGVSEDAHETLLAALNALELLDADPALEHRRNILISPLYEAGDDTARIAAELTQRLDELPALPAKFGFAVDTGDAPVFNKDSADIRIERSVRGLILRADGWGLGMPVTVDGAVDAAIRLAHWFIDTGGKDAKRMARHVNSMALPDWAAGTCMPLPNGQPMQPGPTTLGPAFGAPFGQIDAAALHALIDTSGATALRVTPWRMFVLEGAAKVDSPFITTPNSAMMRVDACPGAPMCNVASVETRALAAQLAPYVTGRLHVSGCAKGCARNRAADITLTGHDGRFDLIKGGLASDDPTATKLTPKEILTRFGAR